MIQCLARFYNVGVSLVSLAAVFSIVTQRSSCVTILKTAARETGVSKANAFWFYGAQSPLCQSVFISWRETARPASPLQSMVTCVYIFRSPLVRQENLKYFDVSLLEFFNLRLVYWPQISRSAPYRSEVRLRCMYALAKEFSVSRTDRWPHRCMWGYRYFEERANSGLFLTAWKMQRNIHAAIQLNVYVFLISSQNNPM